MTISHIKLGTRGSPLALTQTNMVKEALKKIAPDVQVEIKIIRTSGDWSPGDEETRLKEEDGGKGQFAREIETALLNNEIDAAVHSAKDMETTLPGGLILGCYMPREDPRDCIIINDMANNSQNKFLLKEGATIGTASVRRQAFLLHKRPDLKITTFRGNVQTRLDKLKSGQADATLLALAGLKRLGLKQHATHILDTNDFLPAAAQGAVGIEYKTKNEIISSIFSQLNHIKTMRCVECERAAVNILDGSCHTPIGAYAELKNDTMHIRVAVASTNGELYFEDEEQAAVNNLAESIALGQKIGHRLKSMLPTGILD